MSHDHWRKVKLADIVLALAKLEAIPYAPPLGGDGEPMPMEVQDIGNSGLIRFANGQMFVIKEVEWAMRYADSLPVHHEAPQQAKSPIIKRGGYIGDARLLNDMFGDDDD